MKINVDRLYTYPVLADGRDDYKTCKFSAEVKISADAANNLILNANFSTDCAELNRLIANGDAEYLLHAECPSTCYRKIFPSAAENFSCKIPLTHVKDKLNCMAFIVLRRDVEKFFFEDWNEDFAEFRFDLQKGSILAYKNFKSLPLPDDQNIFKNVSSIFSVYKKIDDITPFEFDMTSEKIKIGLNAKDYALYCRYCANPTLQPIMNAMIILPVLVAVFNELKLEDAQDHSSDAWLLSLQAAYRRRRKDFNELLYSEDEIKLAQEVMGLPISKALNSIAIAFDDTAEDS